MLMFAPKALALCSASLDKIEAGTKTAILEPVYSFTETPSHRWLGHAESRRAYVFRQLANSVFLTEDIYLPLRGDDSCVSDVLNDYGLIWAYPGQHRTVWSSHCENEVKAVVNSLLDDDDYRTPGPRNPYMRVQVVSARVKKAHHLNQGEIERLAWPTNHVDTYWDRGIHLLYENKRRPILPKVAEKFRRRAWRWREADNLCIIYDVKFISREFQRRKK